MRALAVLALVAGFLLLGALIGYGTGEATCHDDPDAILRCLGNDVTGLMIGSLAGLTCGLVASALLVRTWRRTD